MRISDWSSDVCSSDLIGARDKVETVEFGRNQPELLAELRVLVVDMAGDDPCPQQIRIDRVIVREGGRVGRGRTQGVSARLPVQRQDVGGGVETEEHTSELQSLMRISYAVFCLKKKNYMKTVR